MLIHYKVTCYYDKYHNTNDNYDIYKSIFAHIREISSHYIQNTLELEFCKASNIRKNVFNHGSKICDPSGTKCSFKCSFLLGGLNNLTFPMTVEVGNSDVVIKLSSNVILQFGVFEPTK